MKKLNKQGFAHHFVLAFVVIGIAVVGTYSLIASHADTCGGTSSPVSDALDVSSASGPSCDPTSNPVSSPTALVSCTIAMADNKPVGSNVTPVLTFKNNDAQTISGLRTTRIELKTPNHQPQVVPSVTVASLDPGSVRTFSLGTLPLGNVPGKGKLAVRAVAGNKLVVSCNKRISITL